MRVSGVLLAASITLILSQAASVANTKSVICPLPGLTEFEKGDNEFKVFKKAKSSKYFGRQNPDFLNEFEFKGSVFGYKGCDVYFSLNLLKDELDLIAIKLPTGQDRDRLQGFLNLVTRVAADPTIVRNGWKLNKVVAEYTVRRTNYTDRIDLTPLLSQDAEERSYYKKKFIERAKGRQYDFDAFFRSGTRNQARLSVSDDWPDEGTEEVRERSVKFSKIAM